MVDASTSNMRCTEPVLLILVALTLVLVGCTTRQSVSNWHKNGVTQEQKASDIGECRRFARRETEREAGIPSSASRTDPLSGAQTYNRMTTNYDLGRFQDEMFARCMRKLGYQPISKKKS